MQCKKLGKQPIASQSYIDERKNKGERTREIRQREGQDRKNNRERTRMKNKGDRTTRREQGWRTRMKDNRPRTMDAGIYTDSNNLLKISAVSCTFNITSHIQIFTSSAAHIINYYIIATERTLSHVI